MSFDNDELYPTSKTNRSIFEVLAFPCNQFKYGEKVCNVDIAFNLDSCFALIAFRLTYLFNCIL
jgi:glutathione peroxidase-family protein